MCHLFVSLDHGSNYECLILLLARVLAMDLSLVPSYVIM
jgi:hypothetical protein